MIGEDHSENVTFELSDKKQVCEGMGTLLSEGTVSTKA